jgi:hypothetical protein
MAASTMLNIKTNQLSPLILRKQLPKKSSSLTQMMRMIATNHSPRLPKITIKTMDMTNMTTIITINMINTNL